MQGPCKGDVFKVIAPSFLELSRDSNSDVSTDPSSEEEDEEEILLTSQSDLAEEWKTIGASQLSQADAE